MLSRITAWVLLATVAVSGCGRENAKSATGEIERIETVPVRWTVTLQGDVNVAVDETVPSRFVLRRTASKEQQVRNAQIVGAEPVAPIRSGPAHLLAGLAVVPFEGDGTYTIAEGSPYDAAGQQANAGSQNASSIKVQYWPGPLDAVEPEQYFRRDKACAVVVTRGGAEGTLTCPSVTDEQRRKTFSLEIRWQAPETAVQPPK